MNDSKHIVIIGNGISGITAARHLRKRTGARITVISKETKYFFSRTALMYIYMGHMRFKDTQPYEASFWKKNKIDLIQDSVTAIDFSKKRLKLTSSGQLAYDKLILATGSEPNMFGWPGQELRGVQGLYSYQDLQRMTVMTKDIDEAVVIGGGLIGVEMAEMLLSRGIRTHFLVRELKFWSKALPPEEADIIAAHMRSHGLDLRLETELKSINDDGSGRVGSITTGHGEEIKAGFAGLAVGVHPNIGFLKDTALETDRGILVNEYLETNIDDVYAIGDCVQHKQAPANRPALEQVWYTGRIMGETVAATISGEPQAYTPGNWFNSAKLFDIEYQVYSRNVIMPPAEQSCLFWQDREQGKAIRIFCDKEDGRFSYISTIGIRLRHEVCDRWLREESSGKYVIEHLCDARFDPELYSSTERMAQQSLTRQLQQA